MTDEYYNRTMNKTSSPITLIKWVYSIVCTVAAGVAMFLLSSQAGAVIWFAFTVIIITAYLMTDKEDMLHIPLQIMLMITSVAAVIISGSWWSAIFFTVPAFLCDISSFGIRNTTAVVFAAISYVRMLKLGGMTRSEVVIYAFFLIGFYIVWALAVFFINKYETKIEELDLVARISSIDSLNERKLREELAKRKALDEANARLLERERISRDIHNSVGHTLSAAAVTLDAAQLMMDQDKELAMKKMEQANSRVHEAIDSIRGAVRTLDSEDDTVLVSDYIMSLKESISNFAMDTDIRVHDNLSQIEDKGKIDIGTAAFLSGALNELLTNGVRHGQANVFVVVMSMDAGNILLKVQDNGRGWGDISFEEKQLLMSKGFGLRKLRDHARSIGGNMEINGTDGFVISISVPRLIKGEEDG